MATIQTSIMIEDRMSQQFAAMNMAMLSVIDSFGQMESASGNAIDVTAMRHAQSELQRLQSTFNQVETEIQQSERAQESFNRDLRTSDDLARKLLGSLAAIVGTYLSLQGIGNLINLSDEMTNTTARVQLLINEMPLIPEQNVDAKINDLDMTELEKANQLIFEAAQRSFSSFKDTADLVTRIGMNAGDAFGSTAEVIAFSELVQKQFGIAGASAIEASNATIQLSQALASGVLRGDELNSIFEQAPNLIMSIADYLEVPIGAIRDMAADGEITADIVKKAMFSAANDINKKFDSMPVTWGQTWTVFKNEALMAFSGVLEYINKIANNEKFKVMFEGLKQSLYTIANITMQAFEILGAISGFLYDNWSMVGPLIIGVAGALMAYYVVMKTIQLVTWLVTAAQWALNAALTANPIGLVIVAVVILIAVFYAVIGAINHFAGTSLNATGMIAGAFMVLATYVYNRVAFMWNIFASFFEFVVNVGTNTTYSIKRLFYNLASNVLDYAISMTKGWDNFATNFVNAIISAVNGAIKAWNWFVDLLPSDIATTVGLETKSEYSHRDSITSDLENIKGSLGDWLGEAPADYWEAPRMDMKSLGDAWDKGNAWGSDLFNFENSKPDPITNSYGDLAALSGMTDAANSLDDLKDPAKKTAKNTKKLADKVTVLTDDLKYLRDLAEREAINRYTTAEIKVDMKNENHINSEMDIDGVIDRFGEKVEEVAEILAEGGEVDV